MATLEGNQEGNRKTNGKNLRMMSGMTDGQVKQASYNPTHSNDKQGKGKSVSTTTGMMTEIKPESDAIVKN
eukprot:6857256-Ditylum_brightwellii.AAC.1